MLGAIFILVLLAFAIITGVLPPETWPLVLIIGVAITIVGILNHVFAEQEKKRSVEPCPPHNWIYDHAGFLFCQKCNVRPAYSGRDDGDQ